LADGIEVLGASMDNGLLHIDMRRIEPETTARKIKINQSPNSKTLKAIDVDKSKKNDV